MADARNPAKKTAAKAEQSEAAEPHEIDVRDSPDSYVEQGGWIVARCTCGWEFHKRYERDRYARNARTAVQASADQHPGDS